MELTFHFSAFHTSSVYFAFVNSTNTKNFRHDCLTFFAFIFYSIFSEIVWEKCVSVKFTFFLSHSLFGNTLGKCSLFSTTLTILLSYCFFVCLSPFQMSLGNLLWILVFALIYLYTLVTDEAPQVFKNYDDSWKILAFTRVPIPELIKHYTQLTNTRIMIWSEDEWYSAYEYLKDGEIKLPISFFSFLSE